MKRAGHKRESEVSIPARELKDVPDQIYSTIVEAILDRALDPGTKLPEEVFCSHYGVSRTVVRIAIHRLEQDDLVEVQKNKGCFIVVPNRQAAADIMAARKALEIYVVKGHGGRYKQRRIVDPEGSRRKRR
jgi:DNA-binding GntR family transcriptional regulator